MDLERPAAIGDSPPSQSSAGAPPAARMRLATRLATDFLLRWTGLLLARHDGDLLEGLVLDCLFSGNGRSEAVTGRIAPLTVSQIAASLQLPFETTRRRCESLIKKGLVRRTRHGLIVRALEARVDSFEAAEAERIVQIRRFVRALAAASIRA